MSRLTRQADQLYYCLAYYRAEIFTWWLAPYVLCIAHDRNFLSRIVDQIHKP